MKVLSLLFNAFYIDHFLWLKLCSIDRYFKLFQVHKLQVFAVDWWWNKSEVKNSKRLHISKLKYCECFCSWLSDVVTFIYNFTRVYSLIQSLRTLAYKQKATCRHFLKQLQYSNCRGNFSTILPIWIQQVYTMYIFFMVPSNILVYCVDGGGNSGAIYKLEILVLCKHGVVGWSNPRVCICMCALAYLVLKYWSSLP